MAKKWVSHQDCGAEAGYVRRMDCHPSPDGIDAHGRAWFVEEFEAHMLAGVHVFDSEAKARAAVGVEWRFSYGQAPEVIERNAGPVNPITGAING